MTWLIVKTSEMIFLALDTSAASMTSAASKTSTASMTSKAFFLKKLPDLDDFIPPWHQNEKNNAFLWMGSLKIYIFTDIWHFFYWRQLRPANITFLKID